MPKMMKLFIEAINIKQVSIFLSAFLRFAFAGKAEFPWNIFDLIRLNFKHKSLNEIKLNKVE